MKRTDPETSELLSRVVERFHFHSQKAKSEDPLVAGLAGMMCEIEICEMWMLTQILRPRI